MTVSKKKGSNGWANNAFGNVWFRSNGNEIAKWKFRINQIWEYEPENHEIYFMFVSKEKRLNKDANNSLDAPNYGFSNWRECYYHGNGNTHIECDDDRMHEKGDEISVTLNTNKGVIKWKRFKNDEEECLQ